MKKIISFICALGVYVALYYFVLNRSISRALDFSQYIEFRNAIFEGWLNTILISLISILLSLVLGLILYLMQESKFQFVRFLAEIPKTIIFSTPLLIIAIVSYYYVGNAFNITSKFLVGSLTLGIYISAYISDIYKGAIDSIHVNQWQAAKMFGFNQFQTYRYIIFPQVFKSILPPLAGQFALTVKGSSLLSYIGTIEWFNAINRISAASYRIPEGFMIVSVGYWIITIPLIILVRRLEKKVNYTV